MRSDVASVQAAVPGVRWWIADPAGGPHIVPGSSATQWYWGSKYHVSTVPSDF